MPSPEACPVSCPLPVSSPEAGMLQLRFAQDSSRLDAAQRGALYAFIGNWHAAGGDQAIRLDGFASEEGDACYNLELSCQRTVGVLRELIQPTDPSVPAIPAAYLRYYAQGETTAYGPTRADNRIVSLSVERRRRQAEPRHPSREEWLERAYAEAGIDAGDWVPRRGFEANESNVRKVYAYYTALFNRDEELLWAGMAKLAGGTVLNGLRQTQAPIDAYEVARDNAVWGDPGERAFVSMMGVQAGYARRLQQLLLAMQKAIFEDLAWQHQAYIERGLPALETLHDSGESVPIEAWRDIASGEPGRVQRGNQALLRREQGRVLPRFYGEIRDIPDFDQIPSRMSGRARSPIPGGRSFEDVVPGGEITRFPDRWRWIERDMLPAYEGLSGERRRQLVNTTLNDLAARRFPEP
ncbi:hypothetical protein [Halomonas ramblicola]|uniref:hypothetical protein n=1 Tax=Halomonas ramblicola TaxID=747349 RepID=UPI0025B2C02B|nr:hypothetical protein [Halomonas ramblicola]MDN3522548.1 hypothetical protein [Halomonas ramblicola]